MECSCKFGYKPQVLQCSRLLLTSAMVLILSACGSATDSPLVNNETADMAIIEALYFDKRTPKGFYAETSQSDSFTSISHVKNTSLLPVVDRAGLTVHELASDDFVEALLWSDKAAEYQQSYKQLADNSDTFLYYQFTRYDPGSPQFINMHRVFKASVLDRNGVDRSDEDARYKGRITLPDITAANVKLIVEYLWTFTLSNNYRNAVLTSSITETENEFVLVMKQARLKLSYSESCDDVEIYEIRYTIPKDSGFIWKDKMLMRVFTAKRTDNFLELCQ